ncbi:methyl-accepting chemotaxis protein [Vibrio sp. WXL103]|uniref:methyl-accepting chemotaxis protein n=1 Tax=unclassified Vibrio TaxID=2614977 RepID=UPI003EC703AF
MKSKLSRTLSLFLIIVGVFGIAIGSGFSYFIVKDRLETNYQEDVHAQIELAEAALVEAIFVYDFEQAEAVANAMVRADILNAVTIVDQRGKNIAVSGQPISTLPTTEHVVNRGEDTIGTIQFQFNPSVIQDSLAGELFLMVVGIILVLIIVIVSVYFFTSYAVITPINHVAKSLYALSSGEADLSQRIPVQSNNEIGQLTKNFNMLMDNLTEMLDSVAHAGKSIDGLSAQLSDVAKRSMVDANAQHESMQSAATSLEEISASADEVYRNAEVTLEKTKLALESSEQGVAMVKKNGVLAGHLSEQISDTSERIDALIQSSSDIGSVVEVILNIAEQTNLLALNAAIEAARAGEQGRGFAVVADEVRALAQKTQNSTSEIETIVTSLQNNAKRAAESMQSSQGSSQEVTSAAESLSEILSQISTNIQVINNMNNEVAVATKQQSAVTKGIVVNIDDLNGLASSIASSASDLEDKTADLYKLNLTLTDNVARFKL